MITIYNIYEYIDEATDEQLQTYLWYTRETYQRTQDFSGEVPTWYEIVQQQFYDPFEKENYTAEVLQVKPPQPDIFVTIKIPFALIPTVQEKISQLILMFSDLGRIPRGEYLELSNIALKFVPSFLTKAEFTALKSAGVVFDENIESLFNK